MATVIDSYTGFQLSPAVEHLKVPDAFTLGSAWFRYTPTASSQTMAVSPDVSYIDESYTSFDSYGWHTATVGAYCDLAMENDTEGGDSSGVTIYLGLMIAQTGTFSITVELFVGDIGTETILTSRGSESIASTNAWALPRNSLLHTLTNAGWDGPWTQDQRDNAKIRVKLASKTGKYDGMSLECVNIGWMI